jgi:hypothetical protein
MQLEINHTEKIALQDCLILGIKKLQDELIIYNQLDDKSATIDETILTKIMQLDSRIYVLKSLFQKLNICVHG